MTGRRSVESDAGDPRCANGVYLVASQRVHSDLFFFSSRRRHTRLQGDWSSDVCSSDLARRAKFEMMFVAQCSSSEGFVGRQAKIRRRLGVSPAPVASNGPVMETEYTADRKSVG